MNGMTGGGPELAAQTMTADDNQGRPQKSGTGAKQGHGDLGRVPVVMLGPAPPWPARDGRRCVVAVLDTGVEYHPWLTGHSDDPVVLDGRDRGWTRPALDTGSVTFRGHATFIAGLVRQAAPACRVLSVPVMDNNGMVAGGDSVRALTWLAGEADSGDPGRYPDVVCLAYGYQPGPDDGGHQAELRAVLRRLAGQGVLVVASAGNQGSDTPTYPAAFAADPDPPPSPVPVTSVGATNPDGQDAHFSNYGRWVTHKCTGSAVISTMPAFDGPARPPDPSTYQDWYPQAHGWAIDPDNFASRFARWSGTSFAAATVAGRLAHALPAHPLPGDPDGRVARARRALESIGSLRTAT